MSVMVWRMDAGDFEGALDIADYALQHSLVMPDRYQRTTATVIAEEVADAAKRARDGQIPFPADVLQRTFCLTALCDMHDQVRAKLHREMGLHPTPTSKPHCATCNAQPSSTTKQGSKNKLKSSTAS